MNLNDKIKKQDLLIEELNNNIDYLIFEQITASDALNTYSLLNNPYFFTAKKTVGAISDVNKAKKEKRQIKKLKGKVKTLISSVESLNKAFDKYLSKSNEGGNLIKADFSRVLIQFYDETEITLDNPKLSKTLKGEIWYDVSGINENAKYLLLKTSEMGAKRFIKLYYKTLSRQSQNGDASLLYKTHREGSSDIVEGDKEEVGYKIIEKK